MMLGMWTVETLNATVDAEVDALPVDMRARLVRIGSIIEAVGFEGLPADTVKHLEGKLWELRVRGKDGMHGRSTLQRWAGGW